MASPDLIPVPEQDEVEISEQSTPEQVRSAVKVLSEKYESLKTILAQNINRLSLSTKKKKSNSTLLEQPSTRREDYELKRGLEVGLRTTTTVGVRFDRLAIGPHVIEKKWGSTEAGMKTENGRGLRRILPGTITVNATTVTGVGTQFTKDFSIGDILGVYNVEFPASTNATVTAIVSDTSLTIASTMTVPTASAYKRNGHDTNAPFYVEATYTNGTTTGLGKLDKAFQNLTGNVFIATVSANITGVTRNICLNSEDIAGWTNQNTTDSADTADTTDPIGTYTADKIIETTATNPHSMNTSLTKRASTDMVLSCYIKKGTRDYAHLEIYGGTSYVGRTFKISDGTVGTYARVNGAGWGEYNSGVVNIGNGWYRCWMAIGTGTETACNFYVRNASADSAAGYSYTGATNQFQYVWGAQVQEGTQTLDTYAKTTGTGTEVAKTSFLRDYRVGDNILVNSATTQMARIISITNNYMMTVNRNVSVTKEVSHQKRSWLAIHAITNETGNKIGIVLSKSINNPVLPAGFTFSRRVGWLRFLDTASNVEVFARFIYDGEEDIWWWNEDLTVATNQFQVANALTGATANVWSYVSASAAIPPTSRHSKSTCFLDTAAGVAPYISFKNAQQFAIPDAAPAMNFVWGASSGASDISFPEDIPVCSCQNFAYIWNNSGHTLYVKVWGYQDLI